MKYVEGAQRRRDPANRPQSSTFYIIEVTQALTFWSVNWCQVILWNKVELIHPYWIILADVSHMYHTRRQTTTRAGVYMAVSSWWSLRWWTVCPRTKVWSLCGKATIATVEFLGRLVGMSRGAKQWMIHWCSNDTEIFNDMILYPILCFFWVRCAILRWTQIN